VIGPCKWVVLGLVIALALAGVGMKLQAVTIGELRADVLRVERALAAEQQSRAQFEATAVRCGASVRELHARSEAVVEKFQRALNLSTSATATAEAEVTAMIARPRPEGLTECAAAKKEADDEITRRAALRR